MRLSHRSNTRTRVMGVLNAVTGEVIIQQVSRTRVPQLVTFLQQVLQHYQQVERLYLVWDNWPVHYHERVMACLEARQQVQLCPLPTYAPWLNPIEKLWRKAKQEVVHTHDWSDQWSAFKSALNQFFEQCNQDKESVLTYTGLSP